MVDGAVSMSRIACHRLMIHLAALERREQLSLWVRLPLPRNERHEDQVTRTDTQPGPTQEANQV